MAKKRIQVEVDEQLLCEIDALVAQERISRSELIRRAMKRYVREQHSMNVRECMKKGYREMAEINSEWAEFALSSEEEAREAYEKTMG